MSQAFPPAGNLLPQCTADQIHRLLDWPALADALTAAFRDPPAAPARHAHPLLPPEATGKAATSDVLLLMPAWNARYIGLKLVTVIPGAQQHGGHTVDASYLLLDRLTGAPQLLLDGEALTVRRTAATSAVAGRVLARPDSEVLLIVGTGRLAPWMARAHCALHPGIRRVLIWGRDRMRAAAMAGELERHPEIGIDDRRCSVEVAPSLESACGRADIISCATTATSPIVQGAWLRPGVHLDLVGAFTPGMREVDDVAVQRALLVVDDRQAAFREAGDILQPLANGAITRDHLRADLRAILGGTHPGRGRAEDITMFKSVGHALEDLAAASLVFERLGSPGATPSS